MDVESFQKLIDSTKYWDARVFDIQSSYLGERLDVFIENDETSFYQLTFLACEKVTYESYSKWKNGRDVSEMTSGQLGYYCHDISVGESNIPNSGLIDVKLNFQMMEMEVRCKDIKVSKAELNSRTFFWEKNS